MKSCKLITTKVEHFVNLTSPEKCGNVSVSGALSFIIENPMCLLFQRHLINCNQLFLSVDTAQ